MKDIPHSKPWITEADVRAVENVLRGGMLGQGALSARFENSIAKWVGAVDAVAVSSGSAAIVLALKALDTGPGDEVILPTYVCVSVLEAVISLGAKPVLTDVGNDWVITTEHAAAHISDRTRAVIVPHIYGIFSDVASFKKLGVPLIEDCAQGFDGMRSHALEADITIFSFHPTKCLTTGEGGMAAAGDRHLVKKMRALRDGRDGVAGRIFSPLSDISAALGLSQLDRYHETIERRKNIAAKYRGALETVVPEALPDIALRTMHFRFPLRIKGGVEACQAPFLERGVHVRRGVDCLLHRLLDLDDGLFPRAVELYNSTVSLPIYPALTATQQTHCLQVAMDIFSARD
jgi:perosamine synthetase